MSGLKIVFYVFFLGMAISLVMLGCKTRRKAAPPQPKIQLMSDDEMKA